MDYSDIYTIMAFFAGSPDGRTRGNDELAEQIAEQGKQFADEHWRWEDMQAYMLRLLLEYVYHPMRIKLTYHFQIRPLASGRQGCVQLQQKILIEGYSTGGSGEGKLRSSSDCIILHEDALH
jgi:hypothetical protein